jgi:hypothetical protein
MHEATLRDFLLGAVTGDVLREDLVGTVEHLGERMSHHHVASLEGEFEVSADQLVRLCDAVLEGLLQPEQLQSIGFCMIASDYFHWDGDDPDGARVAETLYDWAAPEIHYPLTLETARLFRERLVTGRDVFRGPQMA